MSELKEIGIRWEENGELHFSHVYLKSEADKVIAEKDEKIEELEEHIGELQNATDSAWGKVNVYYDELCHSNRKRCLAMAKLCNEKWLVHNFAEVPTKLGFYDKWHKRWLALAEEPTWAKFLQLIHKEAK
jgi:hypothetical protein